MNLKQIQEEELKKFDEQWKDSLMIAFGYKNPDSGMERKVVAEHAYFNLKQFLLSAMEASAKGAIEADHQQLLKAVEEMKVEVQYDNPILEAECIAYNEALKDIKDLLKAKDYMCEICGSGKKLTVAEWNKCPVQLADWKTYTNFPFLPRLVTEWWYFRKNPKHLLNPNRE